MDLIVRPLLPDDFAQWLALWNENNQGQINDAVTKETWARIHHEGYPVFGIGAFEGEALAGILHYVLHPTTGSIQLVGYMQDLYVAPDFRQKGIARRLVEKLNDIGKEQKLTRIYWLAEAENKAAQALYKNLGVKLNFTLHVLPV